MLFWICLAAFTLPIAAASTAADLVRQQLNLSDQDVVRLQQGTPFASEADTPDKSEILFYGAVRIKSTCEAFVSSYAEVEKLEDGAHYLRVRKFSTPPKVTDFQDLVLDREDLLELRKCRAGDCQIQMSSAMMDQFRAKVNWAAADPVPQAQKLAAETAIAALVSYQKGGDKALGEYNDKERPTQVQDAFRTVLGRARQLPAYFPAFYQYLMAFPAPAPDRTTDFYYWENVKFGLKPTFRVNHVSIHQPAGAKDRWLIANKQLYASHYFQTAIDLMACVADDANSFYLLSLKGSRQDGLTGLKGRLLRSVVTSKTKEAMTISLQRLKEKTERR